MSPMTLQFSGQPEPSQLTAVLQQLRRDLHPFVSAESIYSCGNDLKTELDEVILGQLFRLNNPIISYQEACRLIQTAFEKGEYQGPRPSVVLNTSLLEEEGGYAPQANRIKLGPTVRLSQVYHELAHFEGALDIAAACAYYRQLPLYKKLFIRPPKTQVAESLEQYAVHRKWHQDLGRVQLGYETAKDLAASIHYSKLYRLYGQKQHFRTYETCREERIVNLAGMMKIGNPTYGRYLQLMEERKFS